MCGRKAVNEGFCYADREIEEGVLQGVLTCRQDRPKFHLTLFEVLLRHTEQVGRDD